jgi:uncharacterized damage-inducible protein DinB
MTWKAPDVDRPGGPQTGPERPILEAMLNWYRVTLLWKCSGLTGEQLAERAVPPSGLSLLALIRHLTKVERVWFRIRFAGEPVESPFPTVAAEFENVDATRAAADYARLTEEFRLADAAAANASLDDEFEDRDGEPMSLRMLYLHVIEEYARHVGHADLLRERIDGATGELPPRRKTPVTRQHGEDAVVDPAEGEGLHEQVLAAGIGRLHAAALRERQARLGVVRNLCPERTQDLTGRGGRLDDVHPEVSRARREHRLRVAADRADEVPAVGGDHGRERVFVLGLTGIHREDRGVGNHPAGQQVRARHRGIQLADADQAVRIPARVLMQPGEPERRAVGPPGHRPRPVSAGAGRGPRPCLPGHQVDHLDAAE